MSPTSPPQSFLIRFYDPSVHAKDARGRTLNSILAWDDEKLEYRHDYIQILFPLPEGSPFNISAPTIDRATFNAFRSRPELRTRLRKSLERMLQFYGFQISHADEIDADETTLVGFYIRQAADFSKVSRNWAKKFNHNHLRIMRILRSLRVLGLEKEAEEFFKALKRVYEGGQISEKSLTFWTRAIERPLYLAPEDDEDEGEGQDFLYEFEQSKAASSEDVVGPSNVEQEEDKHVENSVPVVEDDVASANGEERIDDALKKDD